MRALGDGIAAARLTLIRLALPGTFSRFAGEGRAPRLIVALTEEYAREERGGID
jgi:hypothetical protein